MSVWSATLEVVAGEDRTSSSALFLEKGIQTVQVQSRMALQVPADQKDDHPLLLIVMSMLSC
jgi:hypothetical protein